MALCLLEAIITMSACLMIPLNTWIQQSKKCIYDVTIHEEGLPRVLLKVKDVLGKDIHSMIVRLYSQ